MSKSHNGVKESEERTYSGGPVPGSSGKKARRGTEIDADDRILVSLKHKLHRRRARVPELDAAVFATADDPLALVRDRDGEHVVLVTREVHGAQVFIHGFLPVWRRAHPNAAHIPVLECFIQRARDQTLTIGSERNAEDRVFMSA